MFHVIFIFSDWILIEQIIASSTPSVLRETNFQKVLRGVLSGRLRHEEKCIDSMHFLEKWTPQIETFSPLMLEHTSQRKFNKNLER